jgi:hypothetical protein
MRFFTADQRAKTVTVAIADIGARLPTTADCGGGGSWRCRLLIGVLGG